MRSLLLLLALGCTILAACTRDVDDLSYPVEPTLQLVRQSDTVLRAFTDTLRLTLAYTDGDGDLGGLEPGVGLYVLDQRLTTPDRFALERLTPAGEELSIAGTFNVALGPYFVLGNAASEEFQLELWLTDRAGNESAHLTTSPLTVTEQ